MKQARGHDLRGTARLLKATASAGPGVAEHDGRHNLEPARATAPELVYATTAMGADGAVISPQPVGPVPLQ